MSDADFDDLGSQVCHAVEFLSDEMGAIRTLMSEPSVRDGVLDFGIAQHDRTAYSRLFPAQLVELAGRAGLAIMVSLFAVDDNGGFDDPPRNSPLDHASG